MKYIIIDDDQYKIDALKSYLNEDDTFTIFNSYISGMYHLIAKEKDYDALILDMNFPLHNDGMPERYMGLNVLNELNRKKINMPVVVFSSDKVDVNDYENVVSYIVYNSSVYLKPDVEEAKTKCLEYKR